MGIPSKSRSAERLRGRWDLPTHRATKNGRILGTALSVVRCPKGELILESQVDSMTGGQEVGGSNLISVLPNTPILGRWSENQGAAAGAHLV